MTLDALRWQDRKHGFLLEADLNVTRIDPRTQDLEYRVMPSVTVASLLAFFAL